MIYVKSTLAGIALLIACLALFTFALFAVNIDLRTIMGLYPFISLLTMLAAFAAGIVWEFRRTLKRREPSPS